MASLFSELIDPDLPDYVEAQAPEGVLPGIFLNAFSEVAGQAGTVPVLTVDSDTAAMAGAVVGAVLNISGTSYTVAERQPKNGGGADLLLRKQ